MEALAANALNGYSSSCMVVSLRPISARQAAVRILKIALFGALTLHDSAIFHRRSLPRAAAECASCRKALQASAANPSPIRTLRGNGRSERREAVVGDRAARRALKVERGYADLRGSRRLDGLEGEHEHFSVGRGRRRLVRDADEDRAVRVDSVAETSCLFRAEIAAGSNRHGFEHRGIEAYLHRSRADLLARRYAQGHVEARARPRARRPLPPELRGLGLAWARVVGQGGSRSGSGDQFCDWRLRRRGTRHSRRRRSALRGELLFLERAELNRLTRA